MKKSECEITLTKKGLKYLSKLQENTERSNFFLFTTALLYLKIIKELNI